MELSNLNLTLDLLRQSPAFDHFDDKALEQLSPLFTSVIFKDGESIPIRRGHNEPHLYLIASGSFDFNFIIPDMPRQVLIKLKKTDLASGFLDHASQRNETTLTADGDCTAFQVEWDNLTAFFDDHVVGQSHFNSAIETLLYQAQLSLFFSINFKIQDPHLFNYLAHEIQWRKLQNGETLFRQGDPGNSICLVLSGRLKSVITNSSGESTVSNIINASEVAGEVAMLTHSQRMTTVFAVRESVVAEFSRKGFNKVAEKYPQSMLQLAKLLGKRLKFQAGKQATNNTSKTYALLPAQHDHCLYDFADELKDTMQEWGSILSVTSKDIEKALGFSVEYINHSRNSLIAQWLGHQEIIYDHIVLVADSYWSNWNETILRHSDHLLIVANSDNDCEPSEHEKKELNAGRIAKHQKKCLILIHPDRHKSITGTRCWLESRQVDDWCHIRAGVPSDMQRLGRLLTGNSNALVLGGGGARGYAHIGVIRALEEHSIPIDKVCGTSIGAIIASGMAIGYDSNGISSLCKKHLNKLFDYTLPLLSLIKGRRIEYELDAAFGEQLIEDLVIPFFCISTNLTRAEQIVHRKGRLKDALRCSMSLPAMIPPICKDGDLIVDGGLLNNLPIDEMQKIAGDCNIIASDISPKTDLTNNEDFASDISGLKLFISRINPFQKSIRTPGILHVLERSVTVAAVNYGLKVQEQNMADLYLELPVENVSTLSYNKVDKTSSLGYVASVKQIKIWANKSN